MVEKKKNTNRVLFDENVARENRKKEASPFETDGGVSWDDNILGLGELFGGALKTSGVSEESSQRKPSEQFPGSYGYTPGASASPPSASAPDTKKSTVIQGGVSGALSGALSGDLSGVVPGKSPENPENPENPKNTGGGENAGTGVTDAEADGYIATLRSILDPNYGARASEDVMGQYAAMTGGRPSSAAISAGTAAKADAESALLRELLAGGTEDGGDGGGLLSGLLGETDAETDMDVPEEYADYADLAGYETIIPMLESLDSEEDMADYLADMVNKGVISDAVATEYLKRFDDPYEVYDEGGRIDYASMVQNPGGWETVNDGGVNFFGGMNRNMRIKAPNGQEFTVAQLYRLLKKNGMDDKDAKDHLVKLQNYLKSKE